MEILSVEKLNFQYPNSLEKSLEDISFSVAAGEFVLLCGKTGSGKTTLLKMLKKEIAPYGEKTGNISFQQKNIVDLKASDIGFVLQNPENQIVCDKVWHELAFGLENMGVESSEIRRRVAEMASYFGIADWFSKDTADLSGGQKQILNLASVMVMSPKLILLDEPTSQLDPIASVEFINTLRRLNEDFGITVILSEHRTEEIMPFADKLMVVDGSRLIACGKTGEVCSELKDSGFAASFSTAARLWSETGALGECPLSVRQAREYLDKYFLNKNGVLTVTKYAPSGNVAIKCKNLCFRYSKNSDDVIKNLNLEIYKGEVHCILGANGSGKTTLIKLLGGLVKPYRGKLLAEEKNVRQKISILPQNVQNVFVGDTVADDFNRYCTQLGLDSVVAEERINDAVEAFSISALMQRHPFDLSGGEQQKCAVAKLMLARPEIVLMDEPVKSLDSYAKAAVGDIIADLSKDGVTVVIVTHDIEFAADTAQRCSLLFNGEIVSTEVPRLFFSENNFYTTAALRIARGKFKNAVTCREIAELCLKRDEKGTDG